MNAIDVINMTDATVLTDASRDDTAAIASVKVKVIPGEDGDGVEREVRLADKLKALELCGKHLGMFKDSPDSTAPVTVVINYDYGPEQLSSGRRPSLTRSSALSTNGAAATAF